MTAAKAITLSDIDLFTTPALVAKAELKQKVSSYVYKPLLGDRKPALNYHD